MIDPVDLLARIERGTANPAAERAKPGKRKAKKPTKPKPPVNQRVGRLDGKLKRKPGGRHAGKPARDDNGPSRLPVNQRLGFRIPEWAALLGISLPSVYRGINADEIEIVEVNGIKYIPRSFAIRKGFITRDDAI